MTDEQKQILEMGKRICTTIHNRELEHCEISCDIDCLGLARELLKHYQPKLPEDAVVLTEDNECLYKNIGKFKVIAHKQTVRDFVKDLLQELDLVGYDGSDFCVTAVKVVAKQHGVDVE